MASNGFPCTHLAITSISCKCGGNMIGWPLVVGSNSQMHSNLLVFTSSMCAFHPYIPYKNHKIKLMKYLETTFVPITHECLH
jgi:hypothetical protein